MDDLLDREWLLTNGLGGFASASVIGCPTRRYHGLLVWSRVPPVQRYVMLATMFERFEGGGQAVDLSTFEFNGALHPAGYRHLVDFDYETAGAEPWARFTWMVGETKIVKRVRLFRGEPHCTITYEIFPRSPGSQRFSVRPMLALRDFHALRRRPAFNPFELQSMRNAVLVRSGQDQGVSLCLAANGPMAQQTEFTEAQDWWYNFLYRREAERGQDFGEDLYAPGWFTVAGEGPLVLEITAIPGVQDVVGGVRRAWKGVPGEAQEVWRTSGPREVKALCRAADQFLVERRMHGGRSSRTVIAGYHWFGDWGRDTCVALPGMLLTTGRYEEARDALGTFADAQHNGLIPNVFDEHGKGAAYNSADASLWFVRAIDQLAIATRDEGIWQSKLGRAIRNVVEAFLVGTDYCIHCRPDGLLWCGTPDTQLTWMDVKFNGRAITPRYGHPVEINALWIHALQVAARSAAGGASKGDVARWEEVAAKARRRFAEAFWYEAGGYLYDVVREDGVDTKLRPNQVIALALPDCPLPLARQRRALEAVQAKLLTPYGLRTLSPDDPEYHARYEGDWQNRDEAYHQGTVWPWLIGPFVEAYLRVNDQSPDARQRAREWLGPLVEHMDTQAGLGSISEIFDADPPHRPRGCIAQAWSVAEVLRAMILTQEAAPRGRNGSQAKRVANLQAGLRA